MKPRKMTPEQEIARIQRDFREHWHELENLPAIQKAIKDIDPIKLGELAARFVYGNSPTKQELEQGMVDYDNYSAYQRRKQLIAEKRKNPNSN
jgi:hypothetical protein